MKYHCFLLIFLLSAFGLSLYGQDSYNAMIYKGNYKFNQKKYRKAEKEFKRAVELNPEDFTAHYNLGNALYKDKKYDEAIAEWTDAVESTFKDKEQAAALHNIGNAYMENGDYVKAADFYKKSLTKNRNKSTLKNLQIAKKKLQNNQNQNSENKEDDSKGNKNKENQREQNSSQPDEENKNSKPKNGGAGEQNSGNSKGKDRNKNKGKQSGKEIPKEVEDAIMNRVANKERNTARRILNQKSNYSPESKEKDW